MDAIQLLNDEERLRHDAKELLESTQLLERLSEYGNPVIEGAYRYSVMTKRDIDIHLEVPMLSPENALQVRGEVGNTILELSHVHKLKIVDFIHTPPPQGKLRGLWYGVSTIHNNQDWSIDLWVTTSIDKQAPQSIDLIPEVQNKLLMLSNEERSLILYLKLYLQQNHPNIYRSAAVYEAVLQNHVTTTTELDTYLATRQGARR